LEILSKTKLQQPAVETLRVSIWRGADEGAFVDYEVPLRENQTVLDVVTEVQRLQEPGLASARAGACLSIFMSRWCLWFLRYDS